ncbi:glycerol kinase isoform X2 [Lepeophtheirus salmonis]|uniref:glycerol kinase isoform X2 n=1 Tax=Lepeophtheirus salmonis TaxID=72036 RepID=UPI001AE5D54A|nr:glycerol kinase-like isoform X2 [Lepeophtheirus salmonis]
MCLEEGAKELINKGYSIKSLVSIGITNQRETTVVWDRITGEPLYNALVWLDTRTKQLVDEYTTKYKTHEYLKDKCGLPISTYFSALKLRWLIDNVPEVKKALDENRLMFGTVDSWIVYKIAVGSIHITDVTNASRTMFMNIHTLDYDQELLDFFEIPSQDILPTIKSSSEIYGKISTPDILSGVPISGILGDQQAALIGQECLHPGMVKSTYGTGAFLLMNVGDKPIFSKNGLLTTVAFQLGISGKPIYALEGSIAVAGSLVSWLRDNMKLIDTYEEMENALRSVTDTGGVYMVPAFCGLFAPYWRNDARGTIVGLSQFTKKEHILRACLESICFQTREIIEAMKDDSTLGLDNLLVDGGMSSNKGFVQILSDLIGNKVSRKDFSETTALGAAMAAGHSMGVWNIHSYSNTDATETMYPSINQTERDESFRQWKRAIDRSLGWIEEDN